MVKRLNIDKQYEVEDALHTLARAEEIKKNAPLMREVKKKALEKQKVLSNVVASKPTRRK